MDDYFLTLVLRWLHILAAMAAVGGSMFMRFALLPAAETLPEEQRRALGDAVRRRWAKVVMLAILFLLVSGFMNYFTFLQTYKSWGDLWPASNGKLYNILFGIKFMLVLVVFFFASALTGRGAATEWFRQNAKLWTSINLLLAVLVVCISGAMRMTHVGPNVPASEVRENN